MDELARTRELAEAVEVQTQSRALLEWGETFRSDPWSPEPPH
jgi:hypothetical protein